MGDRILVFHGSHRADRQEIRLAELLVQPFVSYGAVAELGPPCFFGLESRANGGLPLLRRASAIARIPPRPVARLTKTTPKDRPLSSCTNAGFRGAAPGRRTAISGSLRPRRWLNDRQLCHSSNKTRLSGTGPA
jgi:hypothetical protein